MKHIYLVLIALFLITGCTQKNGAIDSKKPVKIGKQVITKPTFNENQNVLDKEQHIEENFEVVDDGINKIAVLYPSKVVGKYAKLTLRTISAYLIYNNQNFNLETFDSYDENPDSIAKQVLLLKEKGFSKVIALFTQNGFDTMNAIGQTEDLEVYFPLINKEEVFTSKDNFIFGGISYPSQLELLKSVSNSKTSMFYVKSYVGNKLRDYYINNFETSSIIKEVKRKRNNYKKLINDERLTGRMIMLNTPIVKSAIIMSQLTAFEIEPSIILSTQLNYKPDLISLTQYKDRENFFVVNSISEVETFLEEYISLMGANVSYNWVDYSSLVGVNYLIKHNNSPIIKTQIVDNQAQYEPVLYRSTSYGFEKALEN